MSSWRPRPPSGSFARVTIGNEDLWLPPRRVRVGISSDLVISNIDEVSWEVPDGVDRITRGAIWCSSGWLLLRSFQGGRCESGAKIIYRRGALSLFVVPTEDQFLPSDGPPPAANFAA